jgi:catechol 2,3-dioxygenase-like lactoylglutathione lyase family enzyme
MYGKRDFAVTLIALLILPAVQAGQQTPWPPAVSNAGMVYDSASGAVVMYGGMRDRGAHSDSTLWAWNGSRWSALGDGAPGPRSGLILVSDPRHHRILLYGGQNRTTQFDDTWEWREGRWTRITTAGPGARHMTAAVLDPIRNQIVLFGGYSVGRQAMLGDTWVWKGSAWEPISGNGGPPARAGHTMGFDPDLGRVILMGGADAQGRHFRDSWSWDGGRWINLGAGPGITPNTQMVRMPGGGIGTFGGWDGTRPSGSLFRWNGHQWESAEPSGGPSARMEVALAFDVARGKVVLFGGSDANGTKLNDLWEFDGEAWRSPATMSLQPFRTSGAFFALSVPDLDASIQWYTEKLGLHIVMRPPKEDRAEVAVLEGNGLIVELLQLTDAKPFSQAAPGTSANYLVHGFFKAGIVVEDYDAALEALRARGAEIAMGPFPARPGQRANVIVRDNAGNLIQFIAKEVP